MFQRCVENVETTLEFGYDDFPMDFLDETQDALSNGVRIP